jgi:hypothetical protein
LEQQRRDLIGDRRHELPPARERLGELLLLPVVAGTRRPAATSNSKTEPDPVGLSTLEGRWDR